MMERRMAGARETALGIAAVLGSEHAPNPVPVTFGGQSLQEAAEFVQLITAECGDACISLDRLELDPELFKVLEGKLLLSMHPDPRLEGSVQFYRPTGGQT